jgi:hypothetical protein
MEVAEVAGAYGVEVAAGNGSRAVGFSGGAAEEEERLEADTTLSRAPASGVAGPRLRNL